METGRSSAWRSKDRPRLLTMHAMVEKLHKRPFDPSSLLSLFATSRTSPNIEPSPA